MPRQSYLYRSKPYCKPGVKSVQIRSFFWSLFSCIRNEYGYLLRKNPYSVRIQENKDQKKTPYLDTFHAVKLSFSGFLP